MLVLHEIEEMTAREIAQVLAIPLNTVYSRLRVGRIELEQALGASGRRPMSDLRALIEAARADAPGNAARAKVWAGVSTVVGEAVSTASGAGGGAATGSASAPRRCWSSARCSAGRSRSESGSRCCSSGARRWRRPRSVAARHRRRPRSGHAVDADARARADRAVLEPRGRRRASAVVQRVRRRAPTRPRAAGGVRVAERERRHRARASPHLPVAAAAPAGAADEDTLAREASSLAEARGALARRDALSALQIVRGLRALPGRQLVPEELAVEAQALRGLGLDDDANVVETRLRVHFPDSVLGR